jgi:hypothetical protein
MSVHLVAQADTKVNPNAPSVSASRSDASASQIDPNSKFKSSDIYYKAVTYRVNPTIKMVQEGMRNEGTHPTTYSPVLYLYGSGFTKNGQVVAECLCRYQNNSWLSEPNIVVTADQDGNLPTRLLTTLGSNKTYCKGTVKDVATGKVVMNAWQRQ